MTDVSASIGWSNSRLKNLFRIFNGATPKSNEAGFWDGGIAWVTPQDLGSLQRRDLTGTQRSISEEGLKSCAASVLPSGSLVISIRAPIGHLAISGMPITANQGCRVLVPQSGVSSEFYYYVLESRRTDLQALGRGSTFLELSASLLGDILLPYPQLDRQLSIVRFLDEKTAQINALVAAKERFLSLLGEKRHSLISQAVTRGLNPLAPLRDSGIRWLGEIPAHWTLCQLKRVLTSVDYGISEPVDVTGSVAVLRMGDMRDGELDYTNVGFVDWVEEPLLLTPGDLLFNRTNSLDQIGKVALFRGRSDYPVSFASYLVRLRCKRSVSPHFLNWLLNSAFPLAWGRSEALLAIGQANLNPTRYSQLPIAVPPLAEQLAITTYIATSTQEINALRTATERTISLLKERRSALITAAVTGQIDVSEVA